MLGSGKECKLLIRGTSKQIEEAVFEIEKPDLEQKENDSMNDANGILMSGMQSNTFAKC